MRALYKKAFVNPDMDGERGREAIGTIRHEHGPNKTHSNNRTAHAEKINFKKHDICIHDSRPAYTRTHPLTHAHLNLSPEETLEKLED